MQVIYSGVFLVQYLRDDVTEAGLSRETSQAAMHGGSDLEWPYRIMLSWAEIPFY